MIIPYTWLWVTHECASVGYIPGAELLVIGSALFSCSGYCGKVFQSGCTDLHSHQPCMSLPVAPHCPQQLVLSGKMLIIIVGMNNCYFLLRFYYIPSLVLISLHILYVQIFQKQYLHLSV